MNVPIVNHKDYLAKIDDKSKFPMQKFTALANYLLKKKIVSKFFTPDACSITTLKYAHSEDYINNIIYKSLDILAQKKIGFPLNDSVVQRSFIATGGTVLASKLAINFGMACNTAGGSHHASFNEGAGFCVFNDVAVAARYLQKKYKINKIAIIDFDVHHGNGTQEIFYNDRSVAYGSSHEFPLFPGTGAENETGVGNIYNATLKAGTKSREFFGIFEKKILNPIDKFKPEVILISAGFDAHTRDPLANINLESKDFFQITKKIIEISNIHSNGRVISFFEGGYDLTALSESIIEHLKALETHI